MSDMIDVWSISQQSYFMATSRGFISTLAILLILNLTIMFVLFIVCLHLFVSDVDLCCAMMWNIMLVVSLQRDRDFDLVFFKTVYIILISMLSLSNGTKMQRLLSTCLSLLNRLFFKEPYFGFRHKGSDCT